MNYRLLAAFYALLLVWGCSPRQPEIGSDGSATSAGLKKIIVALKPDKDPEKMLEERRTLAAFLADKLGKPVEVIVPLSSSVILAGFVNGSIDLGYLSATDMVNVRQKDAAEILLAGEIKGKTHYTSYWVALKEKPYQSLADLKGKPISFSSKTSTSGYLIPHWAMVKRGLLPAQAEPEEFFGAGNVWYGSGYVSAVERVLNGSAEAAAISYYVLDEDKHLTAAQRDRLKKVEEQGPVPTHVIAIRAAISPAEKAAIKSALETLNQPAHQELRDKLFTSKLVEVDAAAHLSTLDEAMRLTGKAN
jgi:phosphonate transport system substrate-binding protein